MAGDPGLAARYRTATGRIASAREVLASAEAGEAEALRVADLAAGIAGHRVAQAVNWLDPQAVILGGGLGTSGGGYGETLIKAARAGTWSPAARDLPILPAALGPDAGLMGAALTAG
jgi:glucokinase